MSEPLAARWQTVQIEDRLGEIGPSGNSVVADAGAVDGSGSGSGSTTIIVNGQSLPAYTDDTVATALLRAGYMSFGIHAKTGQPLAPTCMMGVCFGCLCTIDGRPGSQACLEPVRHGLTVQIDGPAHTSADVPAS